jgi:transcriptional regulator GlxA family with amidase domain
MNGRLFKIQQWEALARQAKFQPAVMAALCPISLRQLQRFFADVFDQTPGKWARALRCRIARQLVSEGWSNRAVAEELGFGNESHLCHEFKRFCGVPPQTFAPLFRAHHALDVVPRKSVALAPSVPDHQSPVAVTLHSSKAPLPRPVSSDVAV